jgi:hypothetical protein
MSIHRNLIGLALLATTLSACAPQATHQAPAARPLVGTWKLIRATHIEKGDTVVTDKTTGVSFIKIINDTHFAFLQHGLSKASGPADFVAGGGRYTLADSLYTEQLEYCSARAGRQYLRLHRDPQGGHSRAARHRKSSQRGRE